MERRSFFKGLAGSVVVAGSVSGLMSACTETVSGKSNDSHPKVYPLSTKEDLIKLRDEFKSNLFNEFLPFMDKYIIDNKYGGFMCDTDRDGTHIDTNKRAWYQGRGVWVYSYLYNHFDANPRYLEVADKTVEFIDKTWPKKGKLWTPWFTREGKPIGGEDDELYSDLHIAEGFTQYSTIKGREAYWDKAKDILMKCIDVYENRPGYGVNAHFYQVQIDEKKRYDGVPQPRIIGHWMDFLWLTTEMLKVREDKELEKWAAQCVDAVMNYHYNPEYDLINEYLNHDYTRIEGAQGEEVTGHVPETLWMVLNEAERINDMELYRKASKYIKRHIEVLWDDVYGGAFQGLMNVDANEFDLTKALWVQNEIMIGTMKVVETLDEDWAKEWFWKTHEWVEVKTPLKQYGFPLWMIYGDRKMTFERHYGRIGNYHLPRQWMLNIESLNRMIEKA